MDREVQGKSCLLSGPGDVGNLLSVNLGERCAEALSLVFQRFDQPPLDAADATADASVIAQIQFGATGTADFVELDVQNGTVLTVPWGYVEATCFYEADPQPAATYPPQRVICTAYAGPRPGGVRPTRQRRLGSQPNGARVPVPVPKYAVDVRLYTYPNIYGSVNLTTFRAPAGRQLSIWTPTGPDPWQLPSGVRQIEVNVARGAGTVVTLEFGLCL